MFLEINAVKLDVIFLLQILISFHWRNGIDACNQFFQIRYLHYRLFSMFTPANY